MSTLAHLRSVPLAKTRLLPDWRSAPAGTLLQVRELPDTAPLASPVIVYRFDDTMGANGIVKSVLVLDGASAGIIRSTADGQCWPAIDISKLVELCISNAGPIRVRESGPEVGQLVMLPDTEDAQRVACFMAAGYNKELAGYVCLYSDLPEFTPGCVHTKLNNSKLLRVGTAEIRELRSAESEQRLS